MSLPGFRNNIYFEFGQIYQVILQKKVDIIMVSLVMMATVYSHTGSAVLHNTPEGELV